MTNNTNSRRARKIISSVMAMAIVFSCAGAALTGESGSVFAPRSITASADGIDDIKEIVRQSTGNAIDQGLDALTAQIPYLGECIKGPIGDLIKDSLGLGDNKMSIEDLSRQIGALSTQMTKMESELKGHIDAKVLELIDSLNNESVLSNYKTRMNVLSIGGNAKLNELCELDKVDEKTNEPIYNNDEKLFILANVLGNSKHWDDEGNTVFVFQEVSGFMKGLNYISEKDFYTALCDNKLLQADHMFYDEAQAASETYINYMMRDYLAAYAVILQAMQAQNTIINAIDSGDTETFNPDNLRPSYRREFDAFNSTKSKIDSTFKKINDDVYGGDDLDKPCVFTVYNKFREHSNPAFINYGTEKTNLSFGTRSISNVSSAYESVYNNNYRGEKLIKLLVQNARDDGMSIAVYLAAHNNPVPEDAKASSIYEKKSKADVIKDSTVYIGPGYHVG